jgi:uncharacterized phage protein (TIGR02220 family)
MAERRMFAKTIIDSDDFIDMPLSTQALYFHLSMRADDEGFINNPKKIMRMIGASQNEMELLLAKKYVLSFDSGVVVIKHWHIHNYIQKDRFKPSLYREERDSIILSDTKIYTERVQDGYNMDTKSVQIGDTGKVRLGKVRLGKVRLGKVSIGKDSIDNIPYSEIVNILNSVCETKFKPSSEKTKTLIKARFNEGFTVDDFKTVITKKAKEWIGTEMAKYLRPETLFGTKFEGYLNQSESKKADPYNTEMNFEL